VDSTIKRAAEYGQCFESDGFEGIASRRQHRVSNVCGPLTSCETSGATAPTAAGKCVIE
jgi:hypothetical protein